MNNVNRKKLVNSKWTAAAPANREKHFLVSKVECNAAGVVISCQLEAVMSQRMISLQWHELQDNSQWLAGWR